MSSQLFAPKSASSPNLTAARYMPWNRGTLSFALGVDMPSARLAMIPGVCGSARRGVPIVADGVPGRNRDWASGASGIDCSPAVLSFISTSSESGKFIGEDMADNEQGASITSHSEIETGKVTLFLLLNTQQIQNIIQRLFAGLGGFRAPQQLDLFLAGDAALCLSRHLFTQLSNPGFFAYERHVYAVC